MKIPRSFLLGGMRHTVTYRDCGKDYAGVVYHTGQIRIDPRKNKDVAERADSFWHELLHVISHQRRLRLKHATIRAIAAELADFFVDNGYTIEEK